MNEIINEIFEKYQIRKTKKQKTDFIEYTEKKAKEIGYDIRVEKGSSGARNIVVGDPDKAKVIYTAHYDTCPRLPFPNILTPKNIGIYILYNIAVTAGFFVLAFAVGYIFGYVGKLLELPEIFPRLAAFVALYSCLLLMFFGPANKHTANDNTSGVTVLFGIMSSLPTEAREDVALVFFDLEEMGLIGSSSFAKAHKNIRDNTLLINFDCVSDGDEIMILARKKAERYKELLESSYISRDGMNVNIMNKALYPSDQRGFKCGVGVAAFKKTAGGMLYMNRIHTNKDTVYRRENIDLLVEGSVKLAQKAHLF